MACTFHFYINSKLQQDTLYFITNQKGLAFQNNKKKALWLSQLDLQTAQEGNQFKVLHDQLFA